MPTFDSMEIPKPENWQDFERLVESYSRINWPGCIITLFGGVGQIQHGVDIYIKYKKVYYIGIQCKKVARLTYDLIEKEIEKAKNFKPGLKHYFIATSTSRNAKLQEKVNILNFQHNEEGLFSVDILFWEDIIGLIVSDDKVFAQHYPQLLPGNKRGDSYTVYATNSKNSVIGNNIIIKTPKKLSVKNGPIQNTIGSNTYMKNYVKHLINIYHDFKKANINAEGGKMKYSLVYDVIKRETGFKWDETPNERFEYLCKYLQKRIDNTILGKTRKACAMKNYSTYKEFMVEKQGAEPECF